MLTSGQVLPPDAPPIVLPEDTSGPPIAVVVADEEWWQRTLVSILGSIGYSVVACSSGAALHEALRSVSPGLVVLQFDLGDISGSQLCRTLRTEGLVDVCTPIILTSTAPLSHAERVEAFLAGAWDCYRVPFDVLEFTAKLDTYSRAKREADRGREESLTAYGTGLYSRHGLLRVATSVGALLARGGASLSCVVIGAVDPPEGLPREVSRHLRQQVIRRVARVAPVVSRASDVLGMLSRHELAVVTPNTGIDGAVHLARRLLATAELVRSQSEEGKIGELGLAAGCAALDTAGKVPIDAAALIDRAARALERARFRGERGVIETAAG